MTALYITLAFIGGAIFGVSAFMFVLKKALEDFECDADFTMAKKVSRDIVGVTESQGPLKKESLSILSSVPLSTASDRIRGYAKDVLYSESKACASVAYKHLMIAAAREDMIENGFLSPTDTIRRVK